MIAALPVHASERDAEAMLQMIMSHGHIDDEGVLCVPVEDWRIDQLSRYGATDADLEDSDVSP
jgi:hypothetical protein